MFGHAILASAITALAKNFVKTCHEPIYFYVFDLVGSRNFLRNAKDLNEQYQGASHGDILGYIFEMPVLNNVPPIPGTIEDVTLQRWLKFLSHFAKCGKPTLHNYDPNFEWKPMLENNFCYLHISRHLKMEVDPDKDKMLLWKEIFHASEKNM